MDDSDVIVLDEIEEDNSETLSSFSSNKLTGLDDPWTIKYKPSSSDQILDNKQASNTIKNWIRDFTSKSTDYEDYYYDDYGDESSSLESCVLIYGPTGCGKTAMVYALAEELNYKVFEINCSSRRNSKFLNQIKEATLSHTVSRRSNGSASTSPVKSTNNKSKKVIDSKQKTLLNFFGKRKSSSQANKSSPQMCFNVASADESSLSQENSNESQVLSIASNSLLLFDDVDVIFDEDTGFWPSLLFLIANSKKPIILTATTSIENVKQQVRRALCVQMNYPRPSTLSKHMKEIVFKECYETYSSSIIKKNDHNYNRGIMLEEHSQKIESISKENHCDIRSAVNKLQFYFSSLSVPNELPKMRSSKRPNNDKKKISPIVERVDEINNIKLQNKTIDIKAYDYLILSDLFSNTHQFPLNSRCELDNSCTYNETYQTKNLKENVLDELTQLFANQFISHEIYNRDDVYNKENIEWKMDHKQCVQEVAHHIIGARLQELHCDYLPYLSTITVLEYERLQLYIEHTRRARRFLHYLDNIQFYLSDTTKRFLEKFDSSIQNVNTLID